jgi:hypothetical protein
MEVRILKYTGEVEDGTVVIRQEHPLSKFRNLRVYKGAEWEVGKDIPEKTVKNITDMLSHSFIVETVQLDNHGEVLHNLCDFLSGYKERFGKDAESVLPALTVEAILDVVGEGALTSILSALENSSRISDDARKKMKLDSGLEVKSEAGATLEKKEDKPSVGDDGAGEEAEDGETDTGTDKGPAKKRVAKKVAPKKPVPARKK